MVLNDFTKEAQEIYAFLTKLESTTKAVNNVFSGLAYKGESILMSIHMRSGNQKLDEVSQTLKGVKGYYTDLALALLPANQVLGELKHKEYLNPKLGETVIKLTDSINELNSLCNKLKETTMLSEDDFSLITDLTRACSNYLTHYQSLICICENFVYATETLVEEVPEIILNNENFEQLEFQILRSDMDAGDMGNCIQTLDELLSKVSMFALNSTATKSHYIRRVESGSLLALFIANSDLIIVVLSLIPIIHDIYLRHVEHKKLMNEAQTKLSDLQTDATIKNELITEFKKVLNTDTSVEDIESLIQLILKFVDTSKVVRINNCTFNFNTDIAKLTVMD